MLDPDEELGKLFQPDGEDEANADASGSAWATAGETVPPEDPGRMHPMDDRLSYFAVAVAVLVWAAPADAQVTCTWTDHPIIAGQTAIKAEHINEIRECIDRILAAGGTIPDSGRGDVDPTYVLDCPYSLGGDGFRVCYADGYEADAQFVRGVLDSAAGRLRQRFGPTSTPVDMDRLGVGSQLQGGEPQDLAVDLQGCLLGESAEHTHEGDLVRETQPVVGGPPKGDLSPVGLEKGGIADQAGAGDVGTARRQGGRNPALPRAGRVQDRHRQDHRRVPYCALQLHDHQRAQAEPLACITARMVSVPSMVELIGR